MDLIAELKERFKKELPAERAHCLLMNYARKTAAEIKTENLNVRESAVLCLLFKDNGEWKFYLILRNAYKGVHSAQVSFPGGKKEPSDSSNLATALREAHEELNINSQHIEIIGELSTMYIPPSNFLVYPFVGIATQKQHIIPDSIEVKKVIIGSLKDLLKPNAIDISSVVMSGANTKVKVKHYTIDEHVVWGATGMILSELAYLIKELGYQYNS